VPHHIKLLHHTNFDLLFGVTHSPTHTMPRKQSSLYTLGYFSKWVGVTDGSPSVKTFVKCITVPSCEQEWTTTGDKATTTYILKKHLAQHHPQHFMIYIQDEDNDDNSESNSKSLHVNTSSSSMPPSPFSSSPSRKRSITTALDEVTAGASSVIATSHHDNLYSNARKSLAQFLSVCGLPFRIVEQPVFKTFLRDVMSLNGIPFNISRKQISEYTVEHYVAIKRALLHRLSQPLQFCTLALDSYTDVNGDKVNNVMLICNGNAYYYISLFNLHDANTAYWVNNKLTPIITELIYAGVRLVGMVTDNGSVETAVRNTVQQKYKLISIPCAAHTIQLIVRHILATEQSVAGHLGIGNKLIVSDTEWLTIDDVIKILKPFQIATDRVQSNNANLLTVYMAFDYIKQYCNSDKQFNNKDLDDIDWTSTDSQSILSQINYRYNHFTNTAAIKAIQYLSDIQDRQLIQSVSPDQMRYEIFEILKKVAVSTSSTSTDINTDDSQLTAKVAAQLTSFKFKSGKFALTVDETLTWTGTMNNIVTYWVDRLHYDETRELSLAAIALMSINPSEASVERSFSAQKLIHSDLRNRLGNDRIIAQMFIKINVPLMDGGSNTMWSHDWCSEKYEEENDCVEVPME
jgi:hypothetical protein